MGKGVREDEIGVIGAAFETMNFSTLDAAGKPIGKIEPAFRKCDEYGWCHEAGSSFGRRIRTIEK